MSGPSEDRSGGAFGAMARALIDFANDRLPANHRPTAARSTSAIPDELRSTIFWNKVPGLQTPQVSIQQMPRLGRYFLVQTRSGNTYCFTHDKSGEFACFNNRLGGGHIVNQEDLDPQRTIRIGKPGNFAGYVTTPITSIRYTHRFEVVKGFKL